MRQQELVNKEQVDAMFAGAGLCTTNSSVDDDKWRCGSATCVEQTLVHRTILWCQSANVSDPACDGSVGVIPQSEDGCSRQKAG